MTFPVTRNPTNGYISWAAASETIPMRLPFRAWHANNSVGAARYDSFQAKAETKSTRHGLYALLGYTYSRTFDTGMPDGLGTNPGGIYYPLPGTARSWIGDFPL